MSHEGPRGTVLTHHTPHHKQQNPLKKKRKRKKTIFFKIKHANTDPPRLQNPVNMASGHNCSRVIKMVLAFYHWKLNMKQTVKLTVNTDPPRLQNPVNFVNGHNWVIKMVLTFYYWKLKQTVKLTVNTDPSLLSHPVNMANGHNCSRVIKNNAVAIPTGVWTWYKQQISRATEARAYRPTSSAPPCKHGQWR